MTVSDGRRRLAGSTALFLILFGFYTLTHSDRAITDTDLNSLQTRSLVRHGDIDVSRYPDNPGRDAQLVPRGDRTYTIYGPGISVVAAPVYAVLLPGDPSERTLQGGVGAMYAAAAGVILCLVLSRIAPVGIALGGTAAFAFGTTMWPVASMALFQQGPVVMFICLGLLGLFSDTRAGPFVAGAGFGAAAFIRPTIILPLVVIGLFVMSLGRRTTIRFAIGAAVPLLGLLISNRWIWGSWLEGGYSQTGIGFNADAPTTFVGLTIGWWRGIFVYSPFLVLGVFGWVVALRNVETDLGRRLSALGAAALATLLLYSKWDDWGGGLNQFGYRLQLEIVPFLVVLGAFAVARMPKLRWPGVALVSVSILTMTWGAVDSPDRWDNVLFASRFGDTSLGRAWGHLADDPLPGLALLSGVAFALVLLVPIGKLMRPREPAARSPASVV